MNTNALYSNLFLKHRSEISLTTGASLKLQNIPPSWRRITSCEVPNALHKLLLFVIDKEVLLFESKIGSKILDLRLVFKEYYAHVVFYSDRGNPRKLILASRNGKKSFSIHFDKVSICNDTKNLIESFSTECRAKETQFILTVLKKFQADCL